MIKKILLLIVLLLLSKPAFSYNWCGDADIGGCWTIEEGSGTSTADKSANPNTGNFKAAGEPVWSNSGGDVSYSSWSVDFDDSDDYINAGSDSSIDNFATTWTMVAWFRYDGTLANNSGYLISKNGIDKFMGISDDGGSDPNILQCYADTDGSNFNYRSVDSSFSDDTWTHAACNCDSARGSNVKCDLFIDGVETSNQTTSGSGNPDDDSAGNLYLGNRTDAPRAMSGEIDEAAYYSAVKDITDINDMIDNGLLEDGAAAARKIIMIQ